MGMCLGGANEKGESLVFMDFLCGSWGGRPWAYGIDANTPIYANYSNLSCEKTERDYPIRIEQFGFVPDTGGAGKYRGGMAMIKDWQILVDNLICQWRQERSKFAPWGLQGGKNGSLAESFHISKGKKRVLRKEIFTCEKGDLIRAVLPGAGGFGDPYERDVDKVMEDVNKELVTLDAARNDYGVVIEPKQMKVDLEATRKLRQERNI